MSRPLAEIEADMEALKGQKGVGRAIGKLRIERMLKQDEVIAALGAENDQMRDDIAAFKAEMLKIPAQAISTSEPAAADRSAIDLRPEAEYLASDPFSTAEGQFIERCLANLPIEFKGINTNMPRNIYTQVKMKVAIYRAICSVVKERGIGVAWPAYKALNLDPDTGLPLDSRESEPIESPAEPSEQAHAPAEAAPDDGILPAVAERRAENAAFLEEFGSNPAAALAAQIGARAPVPAPTAPA